ncbi:MAG: chromosome partitioning protein ParB [Acidobacteria bacterium]|nr:MAG: chromosome partitioning protein ParB [Acidobacteriota bacterium]
MSPKRKVLGRGLSSLIPEPRPESKEGLMMVEVDRIVPNRFQPRSQFTDLEGLAASIKENGVIQPVIITEDQGSYQLVAGERRWRAAQLAGIVRIPAILRSVSDDRKLEMALVENIQRQELNPLEEARAYEMLLSDLQLTQEEVARRVGKDRSTITNQLRLLKLPDKILEMLASSRLGGGHARAILALPDANQQIQAAETVSQGLLTVRETEQLVRRMMSRPRFSAKKSAAKDPNVEAAEERLTKTLGTKVRIVAGKKKGSGKIEIDYYSEDELDRLFSLMVTRSH